MKLLLCLLYFGSGILPLNTLIFSKKILQKCHRRKLELDWQKHQQTTKLQISVVQHKPKYLQEETKCVNCCLRGRHWDTDWTPCAVIRAKFRTCGDVGVFSEQIQQSKSSPFLEHDTHLHNGHWEYSILWSPLYRNIKEVIFFSDDHAVKRTASTTCYLAALAGADAVVVAWGLVLTHKTGLVCARRGQRGGGAGEQVIWAGALASNCCKHTTPYSTHKQAQQGECNISTLKGRNFMTVLW